MKFLGRLLISILVGCVLLAGVVFAFYQFSPVQDADAIAPARQAQVAEQATARSVINVPFQIPLARLREEINGQIPGVLLRINEDRQRCLNENVDLLITQAQVRIDCKITGLIRKDGDLRVFGQQGALQVRMPVRFRFNVEAVGGLLDGVRQRVNGAIEVRARVVPTIGANWDVDVEIEPDFRWTERAHTNVMGIDIDFASQLRPQVEEALEQVKPEIRKLLRDANIRRMVETAWVQLQEPQQLTANPPVWLTASPRKVLFSGFDIRRNSIDGRLAVIVDTQTIVGARPEQGEPRRLPSLSPLDADLPNGFDLRLPVTVSYGLIRRSLARAELGSRIVEAVDPGQYQLDLKRFQVYPSGDALTIGFDFTATAPAPVGTAEGRAYISAVPVVNWQARTLRLTEMKFASVADNAVVNSATFLISQRPVMQLAEDSVTISFSNEVDFAVGAINDALRQDLEEGIRLRGRLRQSDVGDVVFTEEGIRFLVSLQGQLRVLVSE